MKVVFKSAKEKDPLQDQGLKVFYGPGKRLQYKLRWYMIVGLVSCPLAWLSFTVAKQLIVVEAPAKLHFSAYEVTASEDGVIGASFVGTGAAIENGQQLFAVRNDDLNMKRDQLLASISSVPETVDQVAYNSQRGLLQDKINKAQELVESHRRLSEKGLVTKSEVIEADRRLKFAKTQLFDLNQQHQALIAAQSVVQSARTATNIEKQFYDQKLANLNVISPRSGTVTDVMVGVGSPIKKGQSLALIRTESKPEVWVYLGPKMAKYSEIGTTFKLYFPDNHAVDAKIVQNSQTAISIPNSLKQAFSENTVGIFVKAETQEDIKSEWQVDNLPLKARF